MNMPRQNRKRTGFTLIELLVVISIIAILMALTTAGVMRWLSVQSEKQTLRELLGLSEAADKFKGEFGFYPPSKMVLFGRRSDYDDKNNALHRDSLAVLRKMFPTLGDFGVPTPIDWTGTGTMPAKGEVLDGDQCLVFFLGGANAQGFAKLSDSNLNPAALPNAVAQRIGPFYDFKRNRLVADSGKVFPSYLDPYSSPGSPAESMPYAFFSTGLSRRYSTGHGHRGIVKGPYKNNKNDTEQPSKWLRPDSVQIISAGRDHKFGPGGSWTLAIADPATADDQANFHDRVLGAKD